MQVKIGFSSTFTVSRFLVLHQNLLTEFLKPYCPQEGASSFLHDPTIFNSYALSRKTYLYHLETLASLYWNTVSPIRFPVGIAGSMSFSITLKSALAPDSPLPTQLRQANAALSHLLNKGISPANIVIGGDSAGGNLIFQLMSHILHPLASIPSPPALSQAFAGAMLISPWCKYSADDPSFARNDRKDVLTVRSYVHFMAIGKAELTPELEYYCQPLSSPASWWKGLDRVCSRALYKARLDESVLDSAIAT